MLLLAALRAADTPFGTIPARDIPAHDTIPSQIDELLPLPKWQRNGARCRICTQRLIQLFREEVWGAVLKEIADADRTTDFVTDSEPDTKSPELLLAARPPLAYARTG